MSSDEAGSTPGSGAMSDRVRALLSRAAEEQLLEQRQVSTVLGELRALVEDVDERLATEEQVERVAAQVRELSARVEARLDQAEARSAALAEQISQATALVGKAAQDLVDATSAGVAARVEAQLRELAAETTVAVADAVRSSEGRLAAHVDDAVLALAEVVLRRRSGAAPVVTAPGRRPEADGEPAESDRTPVEETGQHSTATRSAAHPTGPPVESPAGSSADRPDLPSDTTSADPAYPSDSTADPALDQRSDATAEPATPPGLAPAEPPTHAPASVDDGTTTPVEQPTAALPDRPPVGEPDPDDDPGAGFLLVPADVEQPGARPAPPVQQERRSADRRSSGRSDGSGRRRHPWWRPA